jgi:hypothetical protein
MNGIAGIGKLILEYQRQPGATRIERIRISTTIPPDHCYAGRFNGGPPEIVMGEAAWRRLHGQQQVYGVPVVEEA